MHQVKLVCENGHEQVIKVNGMTDDWVEMWAGLLDGTSPMFVHSPIGTDSVIGKCGICQKQLKATVTPVKSNLAVNDELTAETRKGFEGPSHSSS